MRDRLIELLVSAPRQDVIFAGTKVGTAVDFPNIADYLLANGVIVPPCQVGQILFIIEAGLIYEAKVKEYKYCSNSANGIHCHIIFEELFVMSEAHIGKTIFYTREEAEAALRKEDEK